MDYSERLEQMRRDMERRRKEMEDKLASMKSRTMPGTTTQNSPRLSELLRHEGLEDESETKIGTFRRLYQAMLQRDKTSGRSTFGYDTVDYAPLLNPLVCAVEIELSAALEPVAKTHSIGWDGMFGSFFQVLSCCRDELTPYLGQPGQVSRKLDKVKNVRNKVNHKEVIGRDAFYTFYEETYAPFFNETIPGFIRLKKEYRRGVAQNNSRDKAACKAPRLKGRFSVEHKSFDPSRRKCVLFTNTEQLSIKYFNDLHYGGQYGPDVIKKQIFEPYFAAAAEAGVDYILLDASDSEYGRFFARSKGWEEHLDLLDEFWDRHFAGSGICPGLFIVGGHDVVPMPGLRSPLDDDISRQEKRQVLESTLESDWLYSFRAANVRIGTGGYLDVSALSSAVPRFYVGRLPLESGLMETPLSRDLGGYFAKSLEALKSKIRIDGVGAVGCHSCRIVTSKAVEGMPTIELNGFDDSCRYGDVFVSPRVHIDVRDEHDPDIPVMQKYVDRLRQCDMLVLFLHGSPSPASTAFVGEQRSQDGSMYIPAFAPEMLSGSNTKIVVPICCWGARFIGYRRDRSALLTAMYDSGALIYMGSCRSALGKFDACFTDENGRLVAQPEIKWGEMLVRLFMRNILRGIPAGEAMARAKSEYLFRYSDGKPEDLVTVEQFNLFGDPMLGAVAVDLFSEEEEPTRYLSVPDFGNRHFSYGPTTLFTAEDDDNSLESLLRRTRNLVDSNLAYIRERIGAMMYRCYGIDPRTLRKVISFTDNEGGESLRFIYCRPGDYPATVMAETDTAGRVKNVVHTF